MRMGLGQPIGCSLLGGPRVDKPIPMVPRRAVPAGKPGCAFNTHSVGIASRSCMFILTRRARMSHRSLCACAAMSGSQRRPADRRDDIGACDTEHARNAALSQIPALLASAVSIDLACVYGYVTARLAARAG
jgi:hypothetical protein